MMRRVIVIALACLIGASASAQVVLPGGGGSSYTLPAATSSTLGGVKPDGTTITNTAGAISVTYGTGANTAAQGNDSRITGAAPLASPTFTGTPAAPTAAAATNTTQLATTAFVTTAVANAVAGVNPAVAVQAATTQASDTSGLTYNNGAAGIGAFFTGSVNTAFAVDGFTFTALNQRVLIKNDTQSPSGAFNGIYYVTQLQTGILPPILTRALDYDAPSDINNTGAIPVVNGTVNGTTSWLLTSAVATVGTDPLTYTQFSINPAPLAGSTVCAAWTPTDQSGASLTFTAVNAQFCRIGNLVFVYGSLTYPSTADATQSKISLPVAVPNQSYAKVSGTVVGTVNAIPQAIINTSTAQFLTGAAGAVTNATLSLKVITIFIIYPAS
jgi:hypothetical protein